MSVAFENNSSNSNSNRIQLPAMWIYNTAEPARFAGANPWSGKLPAVKEEEDSSSSSSIGNNSDAFSGGGDSDDDDDGEVQSKDNGLLNGLNELEKVLPIKRSLSTFYAGKSKSYGSLSDAVSAPSIQDIVKPDDAYSRKRKNMLAHHALLDKHRETTTENGISKRLARNSHDGSNSSGSVKGLSRPPLPRNSKKLSDNGSSDSSPRLYMSSPWRSLSLSDLQNASSFNGAVTRRYRFLLWRHDGKASGCKNLTRPKQVYAVDLRGLQRLMLDPYTFCLKIFKIQQKLLAGLI